MYLPINPVKNTHTVAVILMVVIRFASRPPESQSRRSDVFTVIILFKKSVFSDGSIIRRAYVDEAGNDMFILHPWDAKVNRYSRSARILCLTDPQCATFPQDILASRESG